VTKTRIPYHTFLGRLQRFHYTRHGAVSVISRAKWDWKEGEAAAARAAVDPAMASRFEDSIVQLVKRSVIYARALNDRFGDHDAVVHERASFKAAVNHFENCMADLGQEDIGKARDRYETLSIWMRENGIKDADAEAG
jgi:hypothetical protein